MRLCYIADVTSIHTERWLSFFAAEGHEVHLITYKPGEIEGVEVHTLPEMPGTLLTILRGIPAARRLIGEIKPDVLHAHYAVKYGWTAALSGFHPFILTVWGSDILITPKESWLVRRLVRRTLKEADLVTCDGDHFRGALEEFGLEMGKLETVYFGVDTSRFRPAPRDEALAAELGIPRGPVVISLRTLKPVYDVATLVRAAPLVLREMPGAVFLICGNGPEEVMLKELTRSLGVDRSVHFLGQVRSELLPRYLSLADVYVSTSLSDAGLAASTAEAMACGLPVVVTDFGDNGRWVVDGVNGFTFPPRNARALAEKLIALLSDKEARLRFGSQSRKVIEARNDYRKEMEKMESIYKRTITRFKS